MLDVATYSSVLLALAPPYALVLLVPGPNLLVVLRAGLVSSVRGAMLAALGIASGATLAAAAAACSTLIAPPSETLRTVGALAFAVFLLRSAMRSLRHAPPVEVGAERPAGSV